MTEPTFSAAGRSDTGAVRAHNEDAFIVDDGLGLYAVLDGMGGHVGGQVASNLACEVLHDTVRNRRGVLTTAACLESAMQAAAAAVHARARAHRELRGMGTTAVACLRSGADVAIAHVGDARAYLLRDGRLARLTEDHTVVAEMVARGALRADEAAHHPYASVLSRNLGAEASARLELRELRLQPGDRLLLCSDGLSGAASSEAIEQILGGAEDADQAVADLIELAYRAGASDNVTALVVDAGRAEQPASAERLRGECAAAWWMQRGRFLDEARKRGVARSPICAVLSESEAIEIVAGNLCEALYHDLSQATSLHVWTYADNLARGWFDQDGAYAELRDLLDLLRAAAKLSIANAGDTGLAIRLEAAVLRALLVAEMAVGGVVADRIRDRDAAELDQPSPIALPDIATTPFLGALPIAPRSPDLSSCLERARSVALAAESGVAVAAIEAASGVATTDGDVDLGEVARELHGDRVLHADELRPILDGLDRARVVHLAAFDDLDEPIELVATAAARVAAAHQRLAHAVALLVTDASRPAADALALSRERSALLQRKLRRGERRLIELERARDRDRDRGEVTR